MHVREIDRGRECVQERVSEFVCKKMDVVCESVREKSALSEMRAATNLRGGSTSAGAGASFSCAFCREAFRRFKTIITVFEGKCGEK